MTQPRRVLASGSTWKDIPVGVVGLGESGRGAVALLCDRGSRVTVFDDRDRSELSAEVLDWVAGQGILRAGPVVQPEVEIAPLHALIVSPGVPRDHPLIVAARASGIEVLSEIELAARAMPGRILAVTGTNGKSTTVSLAHAILGRIGRAHLAGNIGTAATKVAPQVKAGEAVVLEVSSFQLEWIDTFHARSAAVLNVAPDHLNRYEDFEDYAATKRNLLRTLTPDDTFTFPADDARLETWARECKAHAVPFHANDELLAGRDGAFVRSGAIWRRWRGSEERILAVGDFGLLGAHNLDNALAAVASCLVFEVPAKEVAVALAQAQGLPHRTALVLEANGVRYVNDSKATNVHATATSLRGWDGSLVLLLGGSDKQEDYGALTRFLANVRVALCYGQQGERIAQAIAGATQVERFDTCEQALTRAVAVAQSGDAVLLSPACASFDEFKSFEHRGEFFERWVRQHVGGAS